MTEMERHVTSKFNVVNRIKNIPVVAVVVVVTGDPQVGDVIGHLEAVRHGLEILLKRNIELKRGSTKTHVQTTSCYGHKCI